MNFKKTILYFALAILGMTLWHAWQHEYPAAKTGVAISQTAAAPRAAAQHPVTFAPTATTAKKTQLYHASPGTLKAAIPSGQVITVKTDVLLARINLHGGNIVEAQLLKYPVSLKEKNKLVTLLNSSRDTLYVAQSGISAASASKAPKTIVYTSAKTKYVLAPHANKVVVTLSGETSTGMHIEKVLTFKRNTYVIHSTIHLKNNSGKKWSGNIYNQLTRRALKTGGLTSRSYTGASVYTENTPYKKLSYETMSESNFSRDTHGGWIAMQQHYFLSAWIPARNQTYHYYTRAFGHGDDGVGDIMILGYMSPAITLSPHASTAFHSQLYVGPEIAKNLKPLAKGLSLTIDYGWLWPVSKFLFWLMSEIYSVVGNWGWTIILVTILIKLTFYWFSNKSYVSMARTRELQPKIKAMRERLAGDKAAISKGMMELYRKEKINPLGGCLPMVIQIPVFIALYYVLIESVELRQAPFIFWIHDLSMKDPYYILPVLMGLSMLVQQKLSPPPPDPAQAKMMMFLPIIFTIFFATFPAGLVLYWITNNCASVLQQWYVMHTHKKKRA